MSTHPEAPSPDWSRRLLAELEESDRRATAVARDLTAAQLNWHPRPGAWSVGQCLDHLSVANEVYMRAIADSLDGHAHGPAGEIRPGWFGRWFIRTYIDPASSRTKARAPRKITPAPQIDASVVGRFLAGNAQARAFILRAQPYDVNRIRFRNPFIPVIRFTIGTGLEILSRHQHRHLLQAEAVRSAAGFPAR